jgi:hypothetical protein
MSRSAEFSRGFFKRDAVTAPVWRVLDLLAIAFSDLDQDRDRGIADSECALIIIRETLSDAMSVG